MERNEGELREVAVHSSVHEVRFWKNYRILQKMRGHLADRERLIRGLAADPTLPEKTRDEVVFLLKREQESNLAAFHDFLVNFVQIGMASLHQTRITLEFTFREDGSARIERAVLHVDGRDVPLPDGEGQRLLAHLSPALSGEEPDRGLIAFYERIEEEYDRGGGDLLQTCSLDLCRVIFPGTLFRARIRLPATYFCNETVPP
ncbi:MAG: hypothetical protein NQU46_04440 [Methanolinea sp.]|nr:hypothetical protein [Methanolinea sp.]